MQPLSTNGYRKFCDIFPEQPHKFDQCPATQYFFSCIVNRSGTYCPNSADVLIQQFDKRVAKSLQESWHTFWTIVPIVYFFSIAHITSWQMFATNGDSKNTLRRFFVEFFIITVPTILCVNVFNWAVEYIVLACTILGLLLLISSSKNWRQMYKTKVYDLGGNRPHVLTLSRATINMLTALCILAIDFESFPKGFRKSRRFGAALMDTGIGLFAFAMGSVSRPLQHFHSFVHLLCSIIPVLLLGIARTIVIIAIDYHQDEHEYGMHLNAFFTLGLTKLCGSILSATTNNDMQLLLLGLGIAISHECVLQYGISDFVMAKNIKRNTFLRANREGIFSLPGFICIYILAMCFGKCLRTTNEPLVLKQLLAKLLSFALICSGLWMLVFINIAIIGIARVTCNFGYILWIFAIALTMIIIFMFIFDFVLSTILPNSHKNNLTKTNAEVYTIKNKPEKVATKIPILVEVINYNGLVYFLIANILTGLVNIFLQPEIRTAAESVLILLIYMLISAVCAFVLYVFRLKIA